jgi:hypothetical protein
MMYDRPLAVTLRATLGAGCVMPSYYLFYPGLRIRIDLMRIRIRIRIQHFF